MKQVLNTLKRIEHDANEMGKTIRNEGQVWRAELEERQMQPSSIIMNGCSVTEWNT